LPGGKTLEAVGSEKGEVKTLFCENKAKGNKFGWESCKRMAKAIEIKGLTKKYKNFTALDGLTLEVAQGTIFGFLGPNGAGKTTTVRLLTGLAHPTAGSAKVAGIDVTKGDNVLRQKIGFLDQQPRFYSWMSGREFLGFIGELYGLHGSALKTRIEEVLAQTGLSEAATRKVGGYSGGMKQRLGIAQALLNQPEVLFLDEPASALDPAGRRDILEIIGGLRGKTTVFMSTHILADAERVSDQVAIINRGRLVVEASLTDLQNRYAQPVFVLEPEPNQAVKVADLLRQLQAEAWVTNAVLDSGEIKVLVKDVAVAVHRIIPMVAQAEVALARYERVKPNLEDIFLKLIGQENQQVTSYELRITN
jgi:ABC-2 type transport system ATP-binding protein